MTNEVDVDVQRGNLRAAVWKARWKMGRSIFGGFLQAVGVGSLICLGIVLVAGGRLAPLNSTDTDLGHRSGLQLYVDHATHCHYLAVRFGMAVNLVPRMGADGRQVCADEKVIASYVQTRDRLMLEVLDAPAALGKEP